MWILISIDFIRLFDLKNNHIKSSICLNLFCLLTFLLSGCNIDYNNYKKISCMIRHSVICPYKTRLDPSNNLFYNESINFNSFLSLLLSNRGQRSRSKTGWCGQNYYLTIVPIKWIEKKFFHAILYFRIM